MLLAAAPACDSRRIGHGPDRGARPAQDAATLGAGDQALAVEWAGCANIRRGPVCELDGERKLTLWFEGGAGSEWTVATDAGAANAATEAAIEGGIRLTVVVPAGARQLHLREGGHRIRWRLTVADARVHAEIDRLVAYGRTGKYQDALASLEALRATAKPDERGPLAAAMGRMTLGLGQVDRAEPHFRTAIAAAQIDGRLSDVVKDSAGLFWGLVHLQQRYADAQALLGDMTSAAATTPEGRVWLDYHAGLLAADTADIRTAMEKYRRAGRAARRVNLIGMADAAATEMARLLTRIGRPAEALRLLQALSPPKDSCAQATRALNVVWASIENDEMNGSDEARRQKTDAVAAVDRATRDCPDPHRRVMALTYALETAIHDDDRPLGRSLVDELEQASDDHDALHASRRAEVLGRWYLRQGKAATALALFDRGIPAARARDLLEEVFRAQVGAGRALRQLGRRREAVRRLQEAQALLEDMLRGVPLGEGRGRFLSGRDEGVRYLVDALVDSGAPAQALRAARVARSAELNHATRLDRLSHLSREGRRRWDEALARYQHLRAVMEQDASRDWTVPQQELAQRRALRTLQAEQARAALDDAFALLGTGRRGQDAQLPAPKAGEVFLASFPGSDGWLVFAATPGKVDVRRVAAAALASPQAAEGVLDLFTAQLATARRLRLLPYGTADRLDWQMVRWRGKPLYASMEVEYGLDVGASAVTATAAPPAAPSPMPAALVVSNPTGDLAAATPEADAVVRALRGWRVTRLAGGAASRDAVLAGLRGARLFHYAGHAEISLADGLSSALLLGANGRVELGDLLALPSVPEVVVLPACEAAGTVEGGRSALGLAQAFIAAGARIAVAPVRPIGDVEVAAFVSSFYSSLAALETPAAEWTDAVDLGRRAFRDATLATLSKTPDGTQVRPPGNTGCESLRLLLP